MSDCSTLRTVHVERRVVYDVIITDHHGRRVWPHETEKSAVERADSLFRKQLAEVRGEDKL